MPGMKAGTIIGHEAVGGFDGLQAEYARIPYANTSLVPIPPGVSDAQAIMVSDIFPTAWFGAEPAEIRNGDSVAVFGAGPVGQLAILSAYLQGAGRVIAVDHNDDRLALAQAQHAEIDPALLLTEHEPMTDVMAAYREFDQRRPGWVKVALNPAA
jgi:threonine dehydrogenase-like Zn-dependent dehydrogenase